MVKHTPGPWTAVQPLHDPQAWDVITENRGILAKLVWGQASEANARLMAAAPELLEALQRLYNASEGNSDAEIYARLKARFVMATATGQPSSTPRTDAVLLKMQGAAERIDGSERLLELATAHSLVWVEHARQLERELTSAQSAELEFSFDCAQCGRRIVRSAHSASAALTPLERFGLAVLEEHRNEITDVDGGWIQDKAVELGLLAGVVVTDPCSAEYCKCSEYGDFPQECLRETDAIREKMAEFRRSDSRTVPE